MTDNNGLNQNNPPAWYKEAVIYELHIRAFFDSDGDGVGDFKGLTQKLDYLQELGVTALWLLPFYPSPLRDDGYDIADYYSINPTYGDMRDFRTFLKEAHDRGLRVITELVLNHTSDQHPWFQRARRSPKGSRWRNFYVWNDSADRYPETRIIFKDFEPSNWSWDPIAGQYYWHRFYHHQPDLNFDNPEVRRSMLKVLDFWLGMGVDGLRLDAVPYLYERDGTNNENLAETHQYLKVVRTHVEKHFPGRLLLAEANQWPDDAIAYFGKGDECQMAFHFPLMPRLFMSVRMEDRFPVIEILEQTPSIPESCQWALFLRNHDELTLEMVTDEERDYMYRVYASDPQARINLGIRRRLAPLLGNNRRKLELMNGILFSLPGTPIIYYGDELGMGDNVYLGDRNGVRTPMQWSGDRNAGFSRANPQKLYFPVIIDPEYHYETVNVEAEQGNLHSLYSWTKRLIGLRKRHPVFGLGSLEFLFPNNRKVLAYIRRHEDEVVLVVANLSRFAQAAELSLTDFEGISPVELFGKTRFPTIGRHPYLMTLGPHSFYWFSLKADESVSRSAESSRGELPELETPGGWEDVLHPVRREKLEAILTNWLVTRRWFGSKSKVIQNLKVVEDISLATGGEGVRLLFLQVGYTEGEAETYLLPVTFDTAPKRRQDADGVICSLVTESRGDKLRGCLVEATQSASSAGALLDLIRRKKSFHGQAGEISGQIVETDLMQELLGNERLTAQGIGREQSNSSIRFGEKALLKLIRRVEDGPNPELDVGQHLTNMVGFKHAPRLLGAIQYHSKSRKPQTLAVLHQYVASEGDAWGQALDEIAHFFDSIMILPPEERGESVALPEGFGAYTWDIPGVVKNLIGSYLEKARLIGERTAGMHLALADAQGNPDFEPEEFSELYLRSLSHGLLAKASQAIGSLRQGLGRLKPDNQALANKVIGSEARIESFFRRIKDEQFNALRIRVHGDFHLGQMLCAGNDYYIIDFEGEPMRSIGERRLKRSPLKDVAGMIRSYHYAVEAAATGPISRLDLTIEQRRELEPWGQFWRDWVVSSFLSSYIPAVREANLIPHEDAEVNHMLQAFLLEKAIYEIDYELNNRPDWVGIPLKGILQILKSLE
jgi:maltose alpha-D-glucosyltransferase/alpha-amylase